MEAKVRRKILAALRELAAADRPVYLVGGGVRDQLLDRPAHDLDFVLPGETLGLARALANRLHGGLYVLDEERDTTRVILGVNETAESRLVLDFASLRSADLEGDLRARDFTINAMALDVANPDRLIDPTGGLADLREGRIRACSPDSLTHDPVRVLRAIRQALALHFKIELETLKLIRSAAPGLARISAERLRDELLRMLDGSQVSLAMRLLDRVGALDYVLPELAALKGVTQTAPHVSDVWEHTLSVLQHLEKLYVPLVGKYQEENVGDLTVGSAVLRLGRYRDSLAEHFNRRLVPDRSLRALLFFAALYHDIGKPATRQETAEGRVRFLNHEDLGAQIVADRARALALSAAEVSRLEKLVKKHMRVHFLANTMGGSKGSSADGETMSRRSIYRFFKATGDTGVDICLLSLADLRATYETTLPQDLWEAELETCRALLESYWEKSTEVVSPPRYLSGHEVMETFGLKPGRTVGHLLADIREAQATGEIHNREEALAFAGRWMERHFASEDITREEGEE
ncbi:MAG: HD domain-containing protein [Chloroflexi bacterium]|nr:MAG: HD domain-containing protein [Chloroflexota bacterium]